MIHAGIVNGKVVRVRAMSKVQYCRICQRKFINENLHTKKYHIKKVAGQDVHVVEDYIEWYD